MTRRGGSRSHPPGRRARLVERREALRSDGRPRKPIRCRTRAPRETDSQPALVRLADEPLARVRRRVPRKHSGASRRSILSATRDGKRDRVVRTLVEAEVSACAYPEQVHNASARHCERTRSNPDFFRSQNHVKARAKTNWIASSQALLAMTRQQSPDCFRLLQLLRKSLFR